MKPEDERLDKLIGLIKRSEPVIENQERFTDDVIECIKGSKKQSDIIASLDEFLFGWVYVGWVRRSLVIISLAIVIFFGFQQAVLTRRVNELSGRGMPGSSAMIQGIKTNYSVKLRLYRLFAGIAIEGGNKISEDQIEDFIKSVNDLNSEFRDLLDQMNKDTTLRRYVEERIEELEMRKSKI